MVHFTTILNTFGKVLLTLLWPPYNFNIVMQPIGAFRYVWSLLTSVFLRICIPFCIFTWLIIKHNSLTPLVNWGKCTFSSDDKCAILWLRIRLKIRLDNIWLFYLNVSYADLNIKTVFSIGAPFQPDYEHVRPFWAVLLSVQFSTESSCFEEKLNHIKQNN